MPLRIETDPSQGRISTVVQGHLTVEDLNDYYEALHEDPGFDAALDELFDLSEASGTSVAASDLRDFSAAVTRRADRRRNVRMAVVAPCDLAFGMARMYELLQTEAGRHIHVVRTRREAEAWLTLPGDGSRRVTGR